MRILRTVIGAAAILLASASIVLGILFWFIEGKGIFEKLSTTVFCFLVSGMLLYFGIFVFRVLKQEKELNKVPELFKG